MDYSDQHLVAAGTQGIVWWGRLNKRGLKRPGTRREFMGNTLTATCHCGEVAVTVSRRPRQLTYCNCSICRRYGALWAYYSRAAVQIVAAAKSMDVYSWGHKNLRFQRCARCGCVTHYLRTPRQAERRIGVNARMFVPEVTASLRVRHLDGAASWKYLD